MFDTQQLMLEVSHCAGLSPPHLRKKRRGRKGVKEEEALEGRPEERG